MVIKFGVIDLEIRSKPITKQQILEMLQLPFIRWKDNQGIICILNNVKILSTSQGKRPSQMTLDENGLAQSLSSFPSILNLDVILMVRTTKLME
jgi:hypothetical protein